MGANIYIYVSGAGEPFFFRDSYNPCNLAWVIGKSYWSDFPDDPSDLKGRIGFLEALAEITDEQIENYLRSKSQEWRLSESERKELTRILGNKRDYLKGILTSHQIIKIEACV